MTDQVSVNELLRRACELYRSASYQSHTGHWDYTGQGGLGCEECIRAKSLRQEADALMDKIHEQDIGESQ